MALELQSNKKEVQVDVQEMMVDDRPCPQTSDSNRLAMNKQIEDKEKPCGKGFSDLSGLQKLNPLVNLQEENVGNYLHSSETINSNSDDIGSLNKNQDTGLSNIEQNEVVKKESLGNLQPYFGESSNIYVYKNTDYNCDENVPKDLLVEVINMKQNIKDKQEHLEEKTYHEHEECDNGLTNEKSGETKEFMNERPDLRNEPVDSNIPLDNEIDPQHNVVFNKTQSTVHHQGSEVPQNVCSQTKKTVSCIEQPSSDNSCSAISGKFMKPVKIDKDFPSYACTLCSVKFPSQSSLSKHRVFHRNDKKSISAKTDKASNPLQTNQFIGSNERPHTCNECGEGFTGVKNLRQHMISHSTERPHQCSVCKKQFKSAYVLRRHMISHSSDRPFSCSVCGKEFKALRYLRCHMKSHSNHRPHQCNVCGKETKTLPDLRKHMFSHSTERPHQCKVCNKEFKTLPDLKQHMITHSNDRPHPCNVCSKEFKTAFMLRQHMISHSNERPHQCSVCDKEFKTMQDIRKHMISHSTERPHQCDICDKEFKTITDLKKHIVRHGSDPRYQCKMCDKEFRHLKVLKQHIVSHSKPRVSHIRAVCVVKNQHTTENMMSDSSE